MREDFDKQKMLDRMGTGLSLVFRDPLFGYIAGNTFEHYEAHIPPLRAWLEEISKRRTTEHRAAKEN